MCNVVVNQVHMYIAGEKYTTVVHRLLVTQLFLSNQGYAN